MQQLSFVTGVLTQKVSLARRQYCIQFAWRWLRFIIAFSALSFLFSASFTFSIIVAATLIGVGIWRLRRSPTLATITLDNLLLHLNHQCPELEHSAQLVTTPLSRDALLNRLQQQKVLMTLAELISQNDPILQPNYPIRPYVLGTLWIVIILSVLVFLNPVAMLLNNHKDTTAETKIATNMEPASIVHVQIDIVPPPYTQLPAFDSKKLDLTLIAGSLVRWTFEIDNPKPEYFIQFSQGKEVDAAPLKLVNNGNGNFSAERVIEQSGIYHISDGLQMIGTVHSLQVNQDQRPVIRILEPQTTVTQFAQSSQPIAIARVQVSDDFALTKVDILASVAKGSGEAVKFRDQTFDFDSRIEENGKSIFSKRWILSELGMEPGDELYFTVRAWDNKAPEPQLSRSQTKIFRWLEDDEQVLMSEGILLDFMPEYFKSQRQIIIETQQLIADKKLLTPNEFDLTSRSLGQSQGDLKLKYGQYLGDEFDDGSGGHEMEKGPGVPDIHFKDGDHNDGTELDEDAPQQAAGELEHQHEDGDHDAQVDKSGYQEMIEQYGHAHGDTDIGVMGAQSPKALMKQAIAKMWDAELHLMLSQPELALPFEEEALHFLNRAKKAERIYVKRLGFEPPPVTEKRRYQGDLSDIRSYQKDYIAILNNSDQHRLNQLLNLITLRLNGPDSTQSRPFSSAEKSIIEDVKAQLIKQSETRPAMMSYVSTLEKMQLANNLVLIDCELCVTQLKNELWRQLPAPVAQPMLEKTSYTNTHPTVEQYATYLLQNTPQKSSQP